MGKGLKICRNLLFTPFLYWLAGMLLGTILMTFRVSGLFRSRFALAGVVAFMASAVLFHYHHFGVVYIFGHELTHWAVAKLFLKRTGRIRINRLSGTTEIYGTNVAITLAPYILPFYPIVATGIYGLTQLFVYPSPLWARYLVAVVVGIGYAYHVVLNAFAIRQSQSDLQMYGQVFSFGFILAGNALFLLLALLLMTARWGEALRSFGDLAMLQADIAHRVALAVIGVVREWR